MIAEQYQGGYQAHTHVRFVQHQLTCIQCCRVANADKLTVPSHEGSADETDDADSAGTGNVAQQDPNKVSGAREEQDLVNKQVGSYSANKLLFGKELFTWP